MNKYWLAWVLTLSVTGLSAHAENTPTILAIGDSITARSDSYRSVLVPALTDNELTFKFIGPNKDEISCHAGYGGKNTKYLLSISKEVYSKYPADIVMIHSGHNSFSKDKPVPGIIHDTEAMIDNIRKINPDAKILLAQVIPAGKLPKYSYIPELNKELASLSARLKKQGCSIVLVNQAAGFDWKTDTVKDKVHPNAAGAKKMADKWMDSLLLLLDKKHANKSLKATGVSSLLAVTSDSTYAMESSIPFPAALEAAAVSQEVINDIGRRSLVLGNGDLNALLWEREGSLRLRVTKNDIWDARIDTSKDPDLLTIDIEKRTWKGGASHVPGIHSTPYPIPRCAAEVVITDPETKPSGTGLWSAHLDLRRAVATLKDNRGTPTTVRCLADHNVFLIEGAGEVSLRDLPVPYLPAAKQGVTEGVRWLHMNMPGDLDYRGMEYALAVAIDGDRKAVSLLTSYDTDKDVLEAAVELARKTVDTKPETLTERHEEIWGDFWSKSGMKLEDKFYQDAWYRNLYYMRCFCRKGTTMPVALYAGLANDSPGWHGTPTLDYNFEQTFWPMFSCNQVDCMEPYVRFIQDFAPRAR